MTTILITNAISFGVAGLTFLSVATARRRRRRRRRRVQRIYLTLDGRQVTRDEPL
jgi:heme/copper-type cytochrome/quinol oxidase subunit 2